MTTIEDARKLPESPGVYLMRDRDGHVIYVGKASSLRDRVSQYFREQDSPKARVLARNTDSIEFIVTENEVEALVLESNLIKEHMPRYNVRLRDDKAYPLIKITNEEFPRICIARRRERDGARYFGPYPNSRAVREMIKLASALGIRRCRKKLPCQPCLNYHIKQCSAPCIGEVSGDEYRDIVRNVAGFLKGRRSELIASLENEMDRLSGMQEYEKAALVRDRLDSLYALSQRQRVSQPGKSEQDVVAYALSGSTASVQVFHVREGRLTGRDTFTLGTAGSDENEIIASFIKQYYQDVEPPPEIIVPVELSDDSISRWLLDKGGRLNVPGNPVERGLVKLARENAEMLLRQKRLAQDMDRTGVLASLRDALALPSLPVHIEAFDISNISGRDAVGSLVAFENGEPDRKSYRRFRIKTVEGADDFAMMGEVIRRAYSRRVKEGRAMPDLILIDGGKGQLNAALSELDRLGLKLNAAALAKEFEHVFLPGREAPLLLPEHSPERRLLQRIRDEAHRFALAYHKKLRKKKLTESLLDSITGIGEKKKGRLLRHFKSVDKLRAAEVRELAEVPGISMKDAEAVWRFFHKEQGTDRADS